MPRLSKTDLRLYLVFGPQDLLSGVEPLAFLRAVIDGGVTCVQWRDKTDGAKASVAQRIEVVAPLLELCRDQGLPFLINDDVELAQAAGADGVHLGQDDMHPLEARALLGPTAIIGWSIGDAVERARFDAVPEGVIDYLGIGPAFVTGSKADAGAAIGATGIAAVGKGLSLPRVAIGGINQTNAAELITADIDGIAVISALTRQSNPLAAAATLRQIGIHSDTI